MALSSTHIRFGKKNYILLGFFKLILIIFLFEIEARLEKSQKNFKDPKSK